VAVIGPGHVGAAACLTDALLENSRGGKPTTDVTVVRTGPDPQRLRRVQPCPQTHRGHRVLPDVGKWRPSAADRQAVPWGRFGPELTTPQGIQ
jgi:hypothetical protein